jgi:hypothetical protein
LTAMVIAGGSAGVNRLFQQLGFRPVGPGTPPPPSLDETQAWVAVSILRDKAVGSVDVQLNSEVAGTISGSSPKGRFLRYFVRDKGRHPQTGGRTVKAGETYEIVVVGYDAAGNAVTPQPPKWGPHKIAPRAIVDVEFKV